MLVDERITACAYRDYAVGIELRHTGAIFARELRLREDEVERGRSLITRLDFVCARADSRRKLAQDLLYFRLLVCEFYAEFVVHFDDCHRFYE